MSDQLITDSSYGQTEPVVPPTPQSSLGDSEVNYFGLTNFRNQFRKFGIKIDDRRRHMYVVGKTGMGKTTLLENMVLNDIYAGHGVGVVDPHGDFAEKIINFIPPHRINDVVYFNPSDMNYPIGFNILEVINPDQRHLVASGLMGVFKKIWPDVWSARMEYILNNTILALLDYPGTTLLGINRLLSDDAYRKRVVESLTDPVVKAFWQVEFASFNDRYKQEAVAPVQNKIGQFLSASIIRNIVAQVKSSINIREIMDSQKIFIMNLSKGRIGEDNSRLLGGMLITKIQLSAMERVDTPEKDRKDFFLYVDEFQNFATESFANILSEARKYRLDLIMAHQYMEQLDETVLAAVIGNVGTMVTFRVGSTDAEILAKEFIPTFLEEDLLNLAKFHVYLKLMIDGVASKPFSALTMSPIAVRTDSMESVIKVTRERYAASREEIEQKIMRWSGMGPPGSRDDDMDAVEEARPPKPANMPALQPRVTGDDSRPPRPSDGGRKDDRGPRRDDRGGSGQRPSGGGGDRRGDRPQQGGGSARPKQNGGGSDQQRRSDGGGRRDDRRDNGAPRGNGGQGGGQNGGRDNNQRRDAQSSQSQPPRIQPMEQKTERETPAPDMESATPVLLVDPDQKGISLAAALPPIQPKKTDPDDDWTDDPEARS